MVARVGLSSTVARQTLEGKHVLGSTRFRTYYLPARFFPRSLTLTTYAYFTLLIFRLTFPRHLTIQQTASILFTTDFWSNPRAILQPVTADKPMRPIEDQPNDDVCRPIACRSKRITPGDQRTRLPGNSLFPYYRYDVSWSMIVPPKYIVVRRITMVVVASYENSKTLG